MLRNRAEVIKKVRSTKSGDAQAQAILAYRYGYAIDVRRDTNTALEWAKKSAKQGNLYGLLYYFWNRNLSEISATKEELELIEKIKKFAKKGKTEAQFCLGMIYESGFSNKKPNYKSALKWYKIAYSCNEEDIRLFHGMGMEILENIKKLENKLKKEIF